jgi:clan AA aspartic protease
MGIIREEITLKNSRDVGNVQAGIVKKENIRQVTLQAVVDTGAITLVITEEVCETLGLFIRETKRARLADGQWREFKVTEPVEIIWKNRTTACNAYVVPGGNVLLGAIPLEDMDLIVNPKTQKLEGEHGDEPIALLL